jgi:hypothetical protein
MQPEPLRGSMWCGSRLRLHPCMPDSICAWCVLPGHPCGSRLRLHPCMPDSMCAWCVLPGHPTVLRSSQTTDPNKPSPTILGICRKIVAEDGFAGFFRGWWAQILALGASNFIFFYSSSMIKVLVRSRRGVARLDPITNLMVGAVAGVINVMMTTPLWGVMTVLTVQRKRGTKDGVEPYKGMLDGLVRCGREEGVAGLWRGVNTNLILVSNPTIHYFIYDRLKIAAAALVEARKRALSPFEFFVMGAIAKCLATILTCGGASIGSVPIRRSVMPPVLA